MSADLLVNNLAWDLSVKGGKLQVVSKAAQVAQSIAVRLQRQLGEWFLNTAVGIPWYGAGGILGSKDENTAELLVRQEILATPGVLSLVQFNPLWDASARTLSIYAEVNTTYGQASARVTIGA